MSKLNTNISLTGFNDIFSVGADEFDGERVVQLSLSELFAPDEHPFLVTDDEAMANLVESVRRDGVREPGLARPLADGGYELLCGNRRKRACELIGLANMPVLVRELDDNNAIIAMVDSNLQQREKLLPSEKAWAYRLKMEALNHSGVKGERHSCDVMAEQTGESKNQIFRAIRLTELVEDLLDKVDARKLSFNPAVELSYLSYDEQHIVADAMELHEVKPSLSQAVRFKKMKREGTLTAEAIDNVLSEEKKPPQDKETITMVKFRNFFPDGYSLEQIETVILGLLRTWKNTQTE